MKTRKLERDAKAVADSFFDTHYSYTATLMYKTLKKEFIFTAGNGGSSSIANHMACDFMKSPYTPGRPHLRVISLSSNDALLSAIGNDLGYDQTFSKQLQWLAVYSSIVILISSSGSSPNIVRAAEEAKRIGCTLIGFTGNANNSNGGKLREWANVSVHCESTDYGTVENYHHEVMHEVVRQLKERAK